MKIKFDCPICDRRTEVKKEPNRFMDSVFGSYLVSGFYKCPECKKIMWISISIKDEHESGWDSMTKDDIPLEEGGVWVT